MEVSRVVPCYVSRIRLTSVSGEEDGRYGGPTLSLDQWNDALKRNGFTGIDVETPDFCGSEEEQMNIIISSKAQLILESSLELDEDVIILQRPSPSQTTLDTSSHIIQDLQAKSIRATSLSWQADVSMTKCHVIALLELDSSFLADIGEQDFSVLKAALLDASSTLWVTSGMDAENGIVLGLARSMRNENPNLQLRTLHLRNGNSVEPQELARVIQDVFHDSSSEMEFVFKDGLNNVQRLVQDDAMTERVLDLEISAPLKSMRLGDASGGLTLDIGVPGMLDTLHFKEDPESAEELAEDEVEIAVKASGLK